VPEHNPSMSGKTCIVTGANAGIGKATAAGLAEQGATVVMLCRNRERGEAAREEIVRQTGSEAVVLMLADLSSQTSIRQFAEQFKERYDRLHVLINNAAVIPPERTLSEGGIEMQFAVNHLAYFLLTHLLLDVLKRSVPARIINVSSQAHQGASLDFDDLQSAKAYHARRVYSRTKLANVLFTYELARRLRSSGVTANCLHPGVIATNVLGNYLGRRRFFHFLAKLVGGSPEKGARTSLYLATAPELAGVTGRYFLNGAPAKSSPHSHDEQAAKRLWNVSAEMCGVAEAV
jgi:NAD(P)-dependent dehydrogenase (short-subunit alcohol dehydrogenase family)